MAISSDNVLCVGTSIDQSTYDNVTSNTAHNIYLTITPMDDFSSDTTKVEWITDYADEGQCFTGLEITKINDNRFMISWEEYGASQDIKDNDTLSTNILHYIFIDGEGNKLSQEYTADATISDCKPIVKGSKIVYYASSENVVDFYTIDSDTGAFNKVMYRVAGENATWSLDNDGVLTISGTGAISVDTEVRYRYPLSSTKGGYSYSSSDNAWKSIRSLVTKIVVEDGITSVKDKEFKNFSKLTQVNLPVSMQSIGEEAFASCYYLRKIVMFSNITSIGKDALWSGYYSSINNQKITYATIYTTRGSYAATWAEENDVSCKYIDELILTDSTTGTTLKVLGESTTTLIVDTLTKNSNDYNDMEAKVSGQLVLDAYKISTENGMCIGDNELTFTVGKTLKGKTVTLVQKKSDGDIDVVTKKVDSNGQVTITTDELSSFMIARDPSIDDYRTNPIGIYNKLIEGKSVVPFVLANSEDRLTIEDVIESDLFNGKVITIDGTAVTDQNKNTSVKTGSIIKTTDGKEYTAVLYGDVNSDGSVTSIDALEILKFSSGLESAITSDERKLAANVYKSNDKSEKNINSLDAMRILEYKSELIEELIDNYPALEE